MKIAEHKAGIIKENSDTVILKQDKIMEVFENKCKEVNSKLHVIEKEDIKNYIFDKELQKFDYKDYENIEINLKGKSQIYNASEVLEAINILREDGYKIDKDAIYKGLKTVIHRARLEVLSKNPLIIFDGGHNENAIKNLEENINMYYPKNKKVYIISILKTKDYKTIIENICKDKNSIFYFTSGIDKRYVPKEKLYKEAKKHLNEEKIFKEDIVKALNTCKNKYKDSTILIVGSFYVYKKVLENM